MDADIPADVFTEKLEYRANQRVCGYEAVRTGAEFNSVWWNQYWISRCLCTMHQPVQQGGAVISNTDEIVPDAGKRHAQVLTDKGIIVHSEDSNVVGDGVAGFETESFDFCPKVLAMA